MESHCSEQGGVPWCLWIIEKISLIISMWYLQTLGYWGLSHTVLCVQCSFRASEHTRFGYTCTKGWDQLAQHTAGETAAQLCCSWHSQDEGAGAIWEKHPKNLTCMRARNGWWNGWLNFSVVQTLCKCWVVRFCWVSKCLSRRRGNLGGVCRGDSVCAGVALCVCALFRSNPWGEHLSLHLWGEAGSAEGAAWSSGSSDQGLWSGALCHSAQAPSSRSCTCSIPRASGRVVLPCFARQGCQAEPGWWCLCWVADLAPALTPRVLHHPSALVNDAGSPWPCAGSVIPAAPPGWWWLCSALLPWQPDDATAEFDSCCSSLSPSPAFPRHTAIFSGAASCEPSPATGGLWHTAFLSHPFW